MPSFISNFNNKWFIVWVGALAIIIVIIAALEIILPKFSYTPTIVDDEKLWSLERERIGKGLKQIVLSGSSRMLTDISIQTLKSHFPGYQIINLAIDGSCPNDVLKDLSADESFSGIVLVDFREECLFFGHEKELTGQDNIKYFHKSYNLNSKLNRIISTFFQKHLIIIDPYLNILKVLGNYAVKREWRKPRYWTGEEDRTQSVDSKKRIEFKSLLSKNKNQDAERDIKFATQKNDTKFNENLLVLKKAVLNIQKRGGEVFFIRFPIDSIGWAHEEKFFPREKYWEPTCRELNVFQVHFKDYPELQRYKCPDHSHIDYTDKNDLTDNLARIIQPIINSR